VGGGGDSGSTSKAKKRVFLALEMPTELLTSAWTVANPAVVELIVTLAMPMLLVFATVALSMPTDFMRPNFARLVLMTPKGSERLVKVTGTLGAGTPFPSRTLALRIIEEFVCAMLWEGSSDRLKGSPGVSAGGL